MFKVEANIYSRKGSDQPTDTATIITENGCNNVITENGCNNVITENGCNNLIAEYNGKQYITIFNPFVGQYYIDDVYGLLP